MQKYDIVYDETIVSYMELYCFLGAYFQYTVSSKEERVRALHEVAQFCTASFIQRVITEIDTLLVTNETDDDTLMSWLGRISNGWEVENAQQARTYLHQLQDGLREALQHQQTLKRHPATTAGYSYAPHGL